jgi:trk system potassium uptake protein
MHIIIAGAGQVGFHVAKMLSNEGHDIVLIDKADDRLSYAESHIDVSVLKGNAISISLLEAAGVRQADLLIAATSSEETNITTAILGKHLGAKRTIVRISNPEFQLENERIDLSQMGIDSMVFPEDLAAKEICRLLKLSGLTDSFEFGDGKLVLTGLVIEEGASLIGQNMIEAAQAHPNLRFTVVAIQRNNRTLIPRGDTVFRIRDHAYFISHAGCAKEIMSMAGKQPFDIHHVMILGGSLIGREFARLVQQDYKVKLIELNREKSFELADQLIHTMVINGDGSDVELLEEEGIDDMDAFVAVTGDSETNIISCLVAKNHGVKRTIALVENMDYISLSQNIGIDTLINKKMITINNIFRHVRAGEVEALTSLHGVDSEVLEFRVHQDCRIANIPLKKMQFPRDAIIAGVIRGDDSFIADGQTTIQTDDRVVVFSLPAAIHRVEKFFK